MRLEFIKGDALGPIDSVEKLQEKLNEVLDELNQTKESTCWICGKRVMNWGVAFPEGSPDALGFGTTEKNGKQNTRLAFFPFCAEHDLHDEKNVDVVKRRLNLLRSELTN